MDDLVDESVAPARLVWLTAAGERERFGDLLVEATRAHVADEEQSKASFAWWRSDWDAIQRHKDGLTIDGVELRPPDVLNPGAGPSPLGAQVIGEHDQVEATREVHDGGDESARSARRVWIMGRSCVGAVLFGRHAARTGDRRGLFPLGVGALAGFGLTILTIVGLIG